MTTALTARQLEVLETIESMTARDHRAPTIRELGAALGIRSTNAVMDHLKALVRKQCLDRHAMSARGLRVVRPTAKAEAERVERMRNLAESIERLVGRYHNRLDGNWIAEFRTDLFKILEEHLR